jgi:predicted glutamine amidotransferase
MCRWMGYKGDPILLEELLFKPKHSLIDQSMSSHSAETPTNGDGFGVGWFGYQGKAGLYHSIRPAWNDLNLHDIAAQIVSPLFLAHVRATSQATVQETNCHPFRYKNWLFVHNGEIFEIEKLRRDLLFRVAPELFPSILGSTDSEIMFFLALTFGLETDPLGALARMAGFIEQTGRAHDVEESLWMTVAVSDGQSFYAVRYASDGEAPSLYHSREMEDVYRLNPDLKKILGSSTRVIVSEPVGGFAEMWQVVPQNSSVEVLEDRVEVRPFTPSPVKPEGALVV